MTIKEVLQTSREELMKNNIETPGLISGVLLSHVLNCDRSYLISHSEEKLSLEQIDIFHSYIERAISGEPLSYILGYKEFMSLKFEVGRGVLIPRPETELLVEEVIENIISESSFHEKTIDILDICSGSGCIAISLAKILLKKGYKCRIKGVDISDSAMYYSARNARLNSVNDIVYFYKQDIFKADENYFTCHISDLYYDVVVSNPPYIPHGDISKLDASVRDFEPGIALNGGVDGLDFYKRITVLSCRILKNKGRLFFEAGYNQAEQIKSIMSGYFSNITVKKDFSGIDRIVYGVLY